MKHIPDIPRGIQVVRISKEMPQNTIKIPQKIVKCHEMIVKWSQHGCNRVMRHHKMMGDSAGQPISHLVICIKTYVRQS